MSLRQPAFARLAVVSDNERQRDSEQHRERENATTEIQLRPCPLHALGETRRQPFHGYATSPGYLFGVTRREQRPAELRVVYLLLPTGMEREKNQHNRYGCASENH